MGQKFAVLRTKNLQKKIGPQVSVRNTKNEQKYGPKGYCLGRREKKKKRTRKFLHHSKYSFSDVGGVNFSHLISVRRGWDG